MAPDDFNTNIFVFVRPTFGHCKTYRDTGSKGSHQKGLG